MSNPNLVKINEALDVLKGASLPPVAQEAVDLLTSYLPQNVVGIEKAAEILELSKTRVYDLAKGNRIGMRVGPSYVFAVPELKEFKALPRPRGKPIARQ